MKCHQEWSKAKVMLEVFLQQPQYKQRNSVPKDLQLTRHNMSDSYVVYEKQPASNYQTQGQ